MGLPNLLHLRVHLHPREATYPHSILGNWDLSVARSDSYTGYVLNELVERFDRPSCNHQPSKKRIAANDLPGHF